MAKPKVIWMDWCDKRRPWEFAQELFERLEDSGAFIQSRSWEEEGCVVLSKTPLSEKQTDHAIARSRAAFDLDTAQEWIVDVASAVDAHKDLGISAKGEQHCEGERFQDAEWLVHTRTQELLFGRRRTCGQHDRANRGGGRKCPSLVCTRIPTGGNEVSRKERDAQWHLLRAGRRMRLSRPVLAEIIETHTVCEICDQPADVVDHDHQRKTFRGRLCNKCNRGIGFLKDSAELVTRAAIYLQEWEERFE